MISRTSIQADDVEILDDDEESHSLDGALAVAGDLEPSEEASWADLSMQVPNEIPAARIASFVECVLVELRHEPVGAVYRSNEEWGTIETATVHASWLSIETESPFVRIRRDPRAGRQLAMVSRDTVRDKLGNRLTRDGADTASVVVDSFAVHPLSSIER